MNTGTLNACPGCGILIRGEVFPAFHRPQTLPAMGTAVQVQGEAECFNHPGKQAVVACSSCGRLLCSLCEIRLDDNTLCIQCLQSGKEKQKISTLENKRMLYDTLALHLAFLPMLLFFFFFFSLITAPAALFVTLRYWNAPGSLLPRSRVRFVLAFAFALFQIVGWCLFFSGVLD
jgi:hypothetical protein